MFSLLQMLLRHRREQGCGVVNTRTAAALAPGAKICCVFLVHFLKYAGSVRWLWFRVCIPDWDIRSILYRCCMTIVICYRNGGSGMLRPTPPIKVELQDLGAPSVEKIRWQKRGLERARKMGRLRTWQAWIFFARKYIFVRISFFVQMNAEKIDRVVRYIFKMWISREIYSYMDQLKYNDDTIL